MKQDINCLAVTIPTYYLILPRLNRAVYPQQIRKHKKTCNDIYNALLKVTIVIIFNIIILFYLTMCAYSLFYVCNVIMKSSTNEGNNLLIY